MADYIFELRKLVGSRPLIMPGANVLIINDNNEILLHKRSDNGLWGLPGGFCEIGESVEDTAKREVLEEVGLTCHQLELLNVYSGKKQHYILPSGDEVYNVTVSYICRKYSGNINVDDSEGIEARFFNFEEAIDKVVPALKDILVDAKARILKGKYE